MKKETRVFIKGKLNKSYHHGRLTVFKDADIEILEGVIYHVSGTPQSGKSSLLRILSNVEYNDLYTLGFFVKSEDIAYMPHQLFYYRYMTVTDYLDFHQNINVRFLRADAQRAVLACKIIPSFHIIDLSDRDRMLLNLIVCMSQEKKLYVIDDPYHAILKEDYPLVRDLIMTRFDSKKTVIIATEQKVDYATRMLQIKRISEIVQQEVIPHDSVA